MMFQEVKTDTQADILLSVFRLIRGAEARTKHERWCKALLLRCQGLTATQVADLMGVSVRTIYTYCSQLRRIWNDPPSR